jgi:hypothetical protein
MMSDQYGAYPPSGQFRPTLQHHASNRSQESPRDNASSLSTPLSPMFGPSGSGQSSHGNLVMASRPYNPQQWRQNNVVGGTHMAFSPTQRFARDTTGMESE